MIRWHYRLLFKNQRIFLATVYFENSNQSVKPTSKVQVFGAFTRKPWQEKVLCIYDARTKCFKADLVRIKLG